MKILSHPHKIEENLLFVWYYLKMPSFLFQFLRFLLVGVLNTAIDFGILNLLILTSDITSGIYFSFFKSLSFIAANVNSYFWNKYWTFGKKEGLVGQEYLKFVTVSIGAIILNVGTASLVVNLVGPQFGLSGKIWANIGAAFGAAAGLFWNFFGYKFIVFRL